VLRFAAVAMFVTQSELMYRKVSSLRATARRDAQPTRAIKFACVLLILFTIAAILHVHNENGPDLSRPCPVCVAIQCGVIAAVLVTIASTAVKPRMFACDDCERVSPLLPSDLFIRPPPPVCLLHAR
jgi:hypothetical protein